MTRVWIGLGSNLDRPARQIRDGLRALASLPETDVLQTSSLYGSHPMGPADQPDYVNAVAAIETRLDADTLLTELKVLERAAGRRPGRRWGARILDLDILLYGNEIIERPHLVVPHPGLRERPFVLVPLAELAPTLVLPDGTALTRLLLQCNRSEVWYHREDTDG